MRFRDFVENYSIMADPKGLFKPGFSYDVDQYIHNTDLYKYSSRSKLLATNIANAVNRILIGQEESDDFSYLVWSAETYPKLWEEVMISGRAALLKQKIDQIVASKKRPLWKRTFGLK